MHHFIGPAEVLYHARDIRHRAALTASKALFLVESYSIPRLSPRTSGAEHAAACVKFLSADVSCRVPSSLQPVFGGGGALKDRLYSEDEVAIALQRYIEANEELQVRT